MAFEFYPTDTHYDALLTQFSIGWGSPDFIGHLVFPYLNVGSMSDPYLVAGREEYMPEDDEIGDEGTPRRVKRTYRTLNYSCRPHALSEVMPNIVGSQSTEALKRLANDQRGIIAGLKRKIMIGQELEVANAITTASNYASGLAEDCSAESGARQFDKAGGLGALSLGLEAKEAMELACGMQADTAIIAADVWRLLRTDSNFFGSGSADVKLTLQDLAALWEVRQVLVGRGLQVADKPKRSADYSFTRIWPSNFVAFTISPQTVNDKTPATGKIFRCSPDDVPEYQEGQAVRFKYLGDTGAFGAKKYDYLQIRDVRPTCLDTNGKLISAYFMDKVYGSLVA